MYCVPFPKDLVHLLHLDCVCKNCWISIQKSVFFLSVSGFQILQWGGSVRRTNSLNYEDWTFTSYYSSLHSTNSNHKRISGQMRFCLAVPKFYLELAESRQNLWLSEWELSLSQKRNVWHSGTLRRILQVKNVKWCTYHFYREDFFTPHPPKKYR